MQYLLRFFCFNSAQASELSACNVGLAVLDCVFIGINKFVDLGIMSW